MKLDYGNCRIELDNSKGKVYRDGKLMFKGDGYIAIKFMLQWTNNAEEVKNNRRRKKVKQELERRMKEEAERAKSSIETKTKKTKSNNKIQVSKYKIPR